MTNLGHPIKQNISYCVPALEGNTLKLSENKTLSQHKESQPLYVKLNKYFCSSAAPALVGCPCPEWITFLDWGDTKILTLT